MPSYPKRLSELSPVRNESDDDSDSNIGSKKEAVAQHTKLLPKRLHELYLDSFETDDDKSCDKLDGATQLDNSSGFDESVDSGGNHLVDTSTPLGKENDNNSCNRNGILRSPRRQPCSSQNLMPTESNEIRPVITPKCFNKKKSVHFLSNLESTKESMIPLEPRSLVFSPIEEMKAPPKSHTNNIGQSADNFFATPSMKPPLTTGRIIFSTSQQKQRQTRKLNSDHSDYQKTLFTTPQPQPTINHQPLSNTSDYVTDSFNSFKKTPMVSYLSPIEEEKISIDDFHVLSASDDSALTNKIIEINRKDFILKKKIGSGGSCMVYSVKCKSSGSECALKVVNLRTDACNVESYLNETKLLERLQGSDCVIKLFDYLHRPEKYSLFLVMELGENDLNKILKSYQTDIPLSRIVSYWHQMLLAVKYIHNHGVIHSDLKPANFLLVNGRLKLIDFGIASNISMDATSIIKHSQTGTLNYISPEALIDVSSENTPQKNKYKISTKSDVWSLGCIFYLCVYRRTPFSNIKNFYAKYTAITSSDTKIDYPPTPMYYPPMLLEIIQKCLQFNPKTRSSVDELLNYPFNLIEESILST